MSEHDDLLHKLLVLRTQAGDHDALEELVERHHGRLSYFVATLTSDASTTEDVLQDTWLRVYMRIGKLRDPDAFLPWLYRIARNRAFKILGRKRSHIDITEVVAEDLDEPDPFSRAEDAAAVHRGLALLPIEQREALVLRYIEGWDYQQIAETLSCPLGTIRSRIHYGKSALKRILEEDHG